VKVRTYEELLADIKETALEIVNSYDPESMEPGEYAETLRAALSQGLKKYVGEKIG
jgi:hypothetical protein